MTNWNRRAIEITYDDLRKLFKYRDGKLIRLADTPNRYKRGSAVKGKASNGYTVTSIQGKQYLVHRLIWLLHYGYLPEHFIDHIDRDISNNRIENLREVTRVCNAQNSGNSISNTSGVKGVCWASLVAKWQVSIHVGAKRKLVIRTPDFAEAVAYRLAAEQCLGTCNAESPAYKFMRSVCLT